VTAARSTFLQVSVLIRPIVKMYIRVLALKCLFKREKSLISAETVVHYVVSG
jgi:hypothetical protein